MTALLILAFVAGGLWLACYLTDQQPPTEPEQYPQPRHVRVLDDQEPTA